MEQLRNAMASCVKLAGELDATRDPLSPGYAPTAFPASEAEQRVKLAQQLRDVMQKVPAADRARWAGRAGQTGGASCCSQCGESKHLPTR